MGKLIMRSKYSTVSYKFNYHNILRFLSVSTASTAFICRLCKDLGEAYALVSKLREKVSKTSDEANVVCLALLGLIRILQGNLSVAKVLRFSIRWLVSRRDTCV